MLKKMVLVMATLFLASCEAGTETTLCPVTGENYLQNADFSELTRSGGARHWTGIQHAGEDSFAVAIAAGELTITKTGTQPWFILRQRLKDKSLAGKKVAFSADLKLDLQAPGDSNIDNIGGGLSISAKSLDSGKLLLSSVLEHEPRLGKTDWQTVQVVVQLPGRTGLVEAGFFLQADGNMQLRNPSLRLVDESAGACKVTGGLQAKDQPGAADSLR